MKSGKYIWDFIYELQGEYFFLLNENMILNYNLTPLDF